MLASARSLVSGQGYYKAVGKLDSGETLGESLEENGFDND
jgi:hypothetical protein